MVTKTTPISLSSRMDYTILAWAADGQQLSNVKATSVDSNPYSDTRTGVSLPRWRSIIKSGANATTAMSGTRTRRLSENPISGMRVGKNSTITDKSVRLETYSGLPSFANDRPAHVIGTSLVSADNQALSRSYDSLSQQRNHFKGVTALGELRETIQQIRNPFKGVRDFVSRYFQDLRKSVKGSKASKRKVKSVRDRQEFLRDLKQTAGGLWLEVAFGIRPLLSETKALAETVARYQNDSRRSYIYGYGEDVRAYQSRTSASYGGNSTIDIDFRDTTTQSVRYKTALDFRQSADFGSAERLKQLLGFTPDQFIPQLYELIPWSFFVDYFSNLGSVIEAGCADQSEVAWSLKTTRLETIRVATMYGRNTLPSSVAGTFITRGSGDFSVSFSQVSRTSQSKLGQPSLELSLPGKDYQVYNTLALWASEALSLTGRRQKGISF